MFWMLVGNQLLPKLSPAKFGRRFEHFFQNRAAMVLHVTVFANLGKNSSQFKSNDQSLWGMFCILFLMLSRFHSRETNRFSAMYSETLLSLSPLSQEKSSRMVKCQHSEGSTYHFVLKKAIYLPRIP
jgi:hypothetical protein